MAARRRPCIEGFRKRLPDMSFPRGSVAIGRRGIKCIEVREDIAFSQKKRDIMVRMTRIRKTATTARSGRTKTSRRKAQQLPGQWLLRDAKSRFSELVRRVHSDGPQRVTVHGRDEVVILSAAEFDRLKGDRSGEALISALTSSPYRDIDIEPKRTPMPVRRVDL